MPYHRYVLRIHRQDEGKRITCITDTVVFTSCGIHYLNAKKMRGHDHLCVLLHDGITEHELMVYHTEPYKMLVRAMLLSGAKFVEVS